VVEALVAAVGAAYPRLSHRLLCPQGAGFGKKRLPYWDRKRAAARRGVARDPWQASPDTVLSAYGAFSPRMANIAERFFSDRWIDAPVRPGKAPGAFSHPTVPSSHPTFCSTTRGKTRDVMTLAHELGHGVHQVLAAPNGALMAPTPLTLGGDRERVRRDADLPPPARRHHRRQAAQGDAGRQGRGHDQHGWCGRLRSTASSARSTRSAAMAN